MHPESRCILLAALALSASLLALHAAPSTPPARLLVHVQIPQKHETAAALHLHGADARQQVLVTAEWPDGSVRDYTRKVDYTAKPAGVIDISKTGLVIPKANGTATIHATSPEGLASDLMVSVDAVERIQPVNFPNQIVPIFTKNGCNGGGCHGKSGGQNGFRLSLLGFEPADDYVYLVKESRGRRLFPTAPDRSLLLLKPTGTLPHGGGKRIEADSDEYRLLIRWIEQGMPYGNANDPVVTRIEVIPKERTMPLEAEQQLVVLAHYSNGSIEDVTRSALYEVNDKDMAKVDSSGDVQLFQQPGDVAVMVRYQSQVAVFRATVPLGAAVADLPAPNNFVDELVFKKLRSMGMPASPSSDDSTFLRRVTIDVAGRLPTAKETEAFLADKRPDKRDRWIETLLDSPGYADYFANKWSALLRNKRNSDTDKRATYAFHDWIRDSLLENKPYDRFVRDILAASGELSRNPAVAWFRQVKEPTAELEDTAQLFLGMRLQCAQCHHHPFEKWSQRDYYRLAAFFTQVSRKPGERPGEEIIFTRRGQAQAINKKTRQPEPAAGLGATPVALASDQDPRQALVDWMVDPKNPFFARALANRYWKHFFGRGLVDPEDDMRETNPPSDPDLLDALAKHFISSHYDLKDLVRTICRSQTYQLSALPNGFNQKDKSTFSRFYPKRLAAEVLLDAVNQVTAAENRFEGLPAGTEAVQLPDNSFNNSSYFLTVFGRPDASSSCECERSQDASLAQSLHLLNAKEIQEKLTAESGRAAALAKDEKRLDAEKIGELYRWVYSRSPSAEELKVAIGYLQKVAERKSEKETPLQVKRRAYEDMLWALINTKEFLFNH